MKVAIIGAGMAGASLAYHLTPGADVTILEAESAPGYHTSGRSAALYAKSYGNVPIRQLTVASESFYMAPPAGFSETPLLSKRGAMFVARADQAVSVEKLWAEIAETIPSARLIDGAQAKAVVPILRDDYLANALVEDDSRDMDVHAILSGYLRGAKLAGTKIVTDFRVDRLVHGPAGWTLSAGGRRIEADIVVNAAGAWADELALLAGLTALGIQPKRRTAFLVEPPAGHASSDWPITVDVDETFYVKPEAGQLLCSPADETPMPPMDAYPEDLDIAIAVDRIQNVMDLPIRHVARSWAGLRSFAPDKTPVVGFDPRASGFFWLAGQGGYGIQTAPAMGQFAAHLLCGAPLEIDLDATAMRSALAPERLI